MTSYCDRRPYWIIICSLGGLIRSNVFEMARQEAMRSFLESEKYSSQIDEEIRGVIAQAEAKGVGWDPHQRLWVVVISFMFTFDNLPSWWFFAEEQTTSTPNVPSTSVQRGVDGPSAHSSSSPSSWGRDRDYRKADRDQDRDRERERGGSYKPSSSAARESTWLYRDHTIVTTWLDFYKYCDPMTNLSITNFTLERLNFYG